MSSIVPPSIMLGQGKHIQVYKGASVTLECKANGNPSPTIVWTRRTMESDQPKRQKGTTYLLGSVSRHDSGDYQCEARNGVGQPAVENIYLQVLCKNSMHKSIFTFFVYVVFDSLFKAFQRT